jgi:hypothetical protein
MVVPTRRSLQKAIALALFSPQNTSAQRKYARHERLTAGQSLGVIEFWNFSTSLFHRVFKRLRREPLVASPEIL